MRARARLRFSPSREHPRDRLQGGQHFGLSHERIEERRLVGHRAETAPDVDLESALRACAGLPGPRDHAEVVHVDETARMLPAPRERHLGLAAEVLGVGMPEEESHGRPGVGSHVEGPVAAARRGGRR